MLNREVEPILLFILFFKPLLIIISYIYFLSYIFIFSFPYFLFFTFPWSPCPCFQPPTHSIDGFVTKVPSVFTLTKKQINPQPEKSIKFWSASWLKEEETNLLRHFLLFQGIKTLYSRTQVYLLKNFQWSVFWKSSWNIHNWKHR